MFPKPPPRVKTPAKRKTYRQKDPVRPRDHDYVIRRDRQCFALTAHYASPALFPWHQCRTTMGQEHDPRDANLLTVDHFHLSGGVTGKRAKSDVWHMVAMCGWANSTSPPSATLRAAERRYITVLWKAAFGDKPMPED